MHKVPLVGVQFAPGVDPAVERRGGCLPWVGHGRISLSPAAVDACLLGVL